MLQDDLELDADLRIGAVDVGSHRIVGGFGTDVARHGSRSRSYIGRFVIADIAIVVGAAMIAKIGYIDFVLGVPTPMLPYLAVAAAVAVTMCLFFQQMGLYDLSQLRGPFIGLSKVWGGLLLSNLVVLGVLYALKIAADYSRAWMVCWVALSAVVLLFARSHLAAQLKRRIESGELRQHVALFGAEDFVSALTAKLQRGQTPCAVVAACVDSPSADADEAALIAALEHNAIDTLIIAYPPVATDRLHAALRKFASYSTELVLCTDLGKPPVATRGAQEIGGLSMGVIHAQPGSEHARIIKLGLDYGLAVIGLIALAPVFTLIALAIKLEGGGPVFFRQDRYGQNNRKFSIFKFRTMTVAENGTVVTQATRNDSRVTRVGRFLRRSSLDELPQLINVLAGQMSIVGPRPHAIAHDILFEKQVDQFSRRRRVRPGITGWAQVNGFRGEITQPDDVRRRTECDLYYVDNWSIWLDLEIIARSILVFAHDAY